MHTRRRLALIGVLLAAVLPGCVAPQPRDPLTTEEIIRLTAEGAPPEAIVAEIRSSGTIYLMDAEDIIDLHEKGVDPNVIDYMMKTRERDLERRSYYYYAPWHYHHFPGHHHVDFWWCW